MKLYYAPGACSLADHIALHEAGQAFDIERVDIRTHMTEHDIDFRTVSAKGYVPALVLPDGQLLTENIAVLDHLASLYPQLAPAGPLGRSRLIEALSFISTELHRAFKPMWHGGSERERAHAAETVTGHLRLMCDAMKGPFFFGKEPTVADFYLFVMLVWAERFNVEVPQQMVELKRQMLERPAVRAALQAEAPVRTEI
ncbi:MAG: glutathione S-transferase C-terminal domain-containing protein [Alphaproteobacteria bacterium]|nr:glutathione S-transferase C-terminal domain-containing protein [Alphaproteobacteria bacterium]MBU1551344.1 glutathione S-transferase C-terminal domain-containing protein [Alphaproteobacteria bacterium]MBU2336557.1 glutathione S-transferase C-terminal domain-containing protein [Alphaproteobacteria bacterium]MBU2387971.1 glutathione S-transferase C-terminal domain-containing protein [Alphaproteobacteria bacterium]